MQAKRTAETLVGGLLAAFVAVMMLAAVIGAFTAWIAMIALGVLHSYYPSVPAAGFLATWMTIVLLGVVGGSIKGVTANASTK